MAARGSCPTAAGRGRRPRRNDGSRRQLRARSLRPVWRLRRGSAETVPSQASRGNMPARVPCVPPRQCVRSAQLRTACLRCDLHSAPPRQPAFNSASDRRRGMVRAPVLLSQRKRPRSTTCRCDQRSRRGEAHGAVIRRPGVPNARAARAIRMSSSAPRGCAARPITAARARD